MGSNSNAKIMLHGLVDLKNQNFNNIFTSSFSLIAQDLLNGKVIKISDYLGSSVFLTQNKNFNQNKDFLNLDKSYACNNCKDTKIKKQRCVLIRATFLKTKNIAATARKLGVSRTTVYKHIND